MSNRKPSLVFTSDAELDLDDIHQYTLAEWGQTQFDKYSRQLEDGFEEIRKIPTIGIHRRDLPPNYRAYQVEKHLIIYWLTDEKITIIRVLHIMQDIPQHI